jgi:hypothetical protein
LNRKTLYLAILLSIALCVGTAGAQDGKASACLNNIGQKEWTVLVSSLTAAAKKAFDDPKIRTTQVENLRELLAMACEARKLGLDQEETNSAELGYIAAETLALAYDEYMSKGASGLPYARITPAQVEQFYDDPARDVDFARFLKVKTDLIRRAVPTMRASNITAEEIEQAKEMYAKIRLSEKAGTLVPLSVREAAKFRAQLQQAQFLARLYAEELATDVVVSDEEVAKYIASHPEFDVSIQKTKANKILARVKAGEDFPALANEFSEDPGNTNPDGKKNGGLYSDVPIGRMVPEFEKAALALKLGEVSELVQTEYGFHIIRLDARSADGSTYNARHILISTMFKDPSDPNGRQVPASVHVRSKLEAEREATLIGEVVKKNPVAIAEYKPAAPAATKPARRTPASRVVKKKR